MSHLRCLEIIEEVFQGKRDAMSLLFKFAKVDPSGFVKAVDFSGASPIPEWTRQAIGYLSAGSSIAAMKLIREHKKLGHKEAKELCDAAREYLKQSDPAGAQDLLINGLEPIPWRTPSSLADDYGI